MPTTMPTTTLILHCKFVKDARALQTDGYVLTRGNRLAAAGAMTDMPDLQADMIIDGRHTLVMPGLINGHCHSPMTLFRGLADDLPLMDWLHQHIFPAEAAHVSAEMVYWCSKLAAAEMLLSGTTCVADAYFLCDHAARAFNEAGLRAVVAHGIVDFPAPGVPDRRRNIDAVDAFVRQWRTRTPLITPAVFAHSPYTCSPDTLLRAKRLADRHGVRFFIHLAESPQEANMLIAPQGDSPVRHLQALGLLDSNCILVHAVWLDDEDLDIVARSGAGIILCPQSNYKLASGRSRARDMLRLGIPLGLGTDGCASNNGLDMFAEMDMLAKSHKAFEADPTVLPAPTALHMATCGNNGILGFDTTVAIRSGSRADLVLIDLDQPHLTPFYNNDLLIYAARGSDVRSVMIDGRLVVVDRQIISFDVAESVARVRELSLPLRGLIC